MSSPKTNWTEMLTLVRWYILCTTREAAARMPVHGSASSTYIYCRLYVSYVHDSLVLDVFVVAFSYGFPMESGLLLIPYTFSIKIILNLRPRNYLPWSYVISTGHGYWTSHVVSTSFAIAIAFLFLYWVTSNRLDMGYIALTDFKIKGYFPFLRIL